jgi:hypothetical protein
MHSTSHYSKLGLLSFLYLHQSLPLSGSNNVFCFRTHVWLAAVSWLTDFGRSVKLLLAFASTVIPGFSIFQIHGQELCSVLDMYVFRSGASSSTREGSVSLWRRYVCCTVVSARVYPHFTASRSLWTLCTLCCRTVSSNIYTRYTEVFY